MAPEEATQAESTAPRGGSTPEGNVTPPEPAPAADAAPVPAPTTESAATATGGGASEPKPSSASRARLLEFPGRGRNKEWVGPLIDYKEIDLIRKFMTTSHKLMSRKRAGTTAQEQKALKLSAKRARYMALLPYSGT